VLVTSTTSGARLETYVIESERGSGTVSINGAAAHLIGKGEKVIVMGFEITDRPIRPRVVLCDEHNGVAEFLTEEPPTRDAPGAR